LAHHRNQLGAGGRVALVVVDGLALDQWVVLRDSLGGLRCEEGATFAWVPTLTTVSRQAIFSGEVPFHFADHLHTTSREAAHWARFWDDHGCVEVPLRTGVKAMPTTTRSAPKWESS
jgi:hypothetical protein